MIPPWNDNARVFTWYYVDAIRQTNNYWEKKLKINIFRIKIALGFYHMQSAYDRDDYVTIHWENMPASAKYNFNKYSSDWVTHFNTTYDYESVMHYEAYAYSKNGEATIVHSTHRSEFFSIFVLCVAYTHASTWQVFVWQYTFAYLHTQVQRVCFSRSSVKHAFFRVFVIYFVNICNDFHTNKKNISCEFYRAS